MLVVAAQVRLDTELLYRGREKERNNHVLQLLIC